MVFDPPGEWWGEKKLLCFSHLNEFVTSTYPWCPVFTLCDFSVVFAGCHSADIHFGRENVLNRLFPPEQDHGAYPCDEHPGHQHCPAPVRDPVPAYHVLVRSPSQERG